MYEPAQVSMKKDAYIQFLLLGENGLRTVSSPAERGRTKVVHPLGYFAFGN